MDNSGKPLTRWLAAIAIACACSACEVPGLAWAYAEQGGGSDTAVYIMPYLSGSGGDHDTVDPGGPVGLGDAIEAGNLVHTVDIAPDPGLRPEGVSSPDLFPLTGDGLGFLSGVLGVLGAGVGIALFGSLGRGKDRGGDGGRIT